jgi:hypothetical protein
MFGYGPGMGFLSDGGNVGPMQSSVLPAPNSPPVSFVYFWPIVEQHHHYDVSYYTGNSAANGPFAWGDYTFSNFSIDTVDYYSIFGHTSMYHVSSNSGYGSWFSAPGYNVSSGHYWSSESAGIHTDSIWGSSDQFAFRNVESQNSHVQIGALGIDNSHIEIHEGAGVHVATVFEHLDSFAFRDAVIDSSHVQIGNYAFDSLHTDVRTGSQTVYADLFGGYGVSRGSSVAIHDEWSQQGNGSVEQHTTDYASHSSDSIVSGVPAYMISSLQVDDMALMLGIGGKG